jgi:flagellar assembly factor FliW
VNVITKAYGPVEVEEQQRITFPCGLFGFESFKDYVLFDADEHPFCWLQSVDDVQVAFVMINPFLIMPDYEVSIDNEELAEIELSSPEQALVFAIVTIPADGSPITANLQGPLIINQSTQLGKQAVLVDPYWKTKHDIMTGLMI